MRWATVVGPILMMLSGVMGQLGARETVEVELDLANVPGWRAFGNVAKADFKKELEESLLKRLTELLPAWDFKAAQTGTTRLVIRFQDNGSGDPANRGISATMELQRPGATSKSWLRTEMVELCGPGDPDWAKALCQREAGKEAGRFLAKRLSQKALDGHKEECRENFCHFIPVAQQAGYHSDHRGWIGFYDDGFKFNMFRIVAEIPGQGLLMFEGKGTEGPYQVQGLAVASLVIFFKKDEPNLKQAKPGPKVFLWEFYPSSGADIAD